MQQDGDSAVSDIGEVYTDTITATAQETLGEGSGAPGIESGEGNPGGMGGAAPQRICDN